MMSFMESAWTPRRQGDLGEVSAMQWLVAAGAIVWVPLVSAPDYDLIAEFDDRLVRVQVKTSTCWKNDRFIVALCTRGGNQSWNGIVKRLDASRCDAVFVHVGDGRRWYIPASALGGGSGIVLGGPKYSEYEVESGRPLQARPPPVDTAA
jgi:PD-(D/E)XK nuclease superfamily protein